jgi:hypothetical protein
MHVPLHLQAFSAKCTDGAGWPTCSKTDILQEMKALLLIPPAEQEPYQWSGSCFSPFEITAERWKAAFCVGGIEITDNEEARCCIGLCCS